MHRWNQVLCLVAMAGFLGCSGGSGDRPKTVKAGGTVTLDGAPVEGASVSFAAQGGGRSAIGKTDAAGRFTVNTTNTIPGVMPGEYKVGISKEKTEGAMTAEESQKYFEKTGKGPPSPKVTNELPDKYENPATSGFSAKVEAGGANDFKFEMKK